MLEQAKIVNAKIKSILGESSSDDVINYTHFLFVLHNGISVSMPWGYDPADDFMIHIEPADGYEPLNWGDPKSKWTPLWGGDITDVMIPEDPEKRTPDSGIIPLSTGWTVVQMSSAPIGIVPCVDIVLSEEMDEPMISVWDKNIRFE